MIKGSPNTSMRTLTRDDPVIGYTTVPGNFTYLVVIECGGNFHKDAFLVIDGRTVTPSAFNLYVRSSVYPEFINIAGVTPSDSNPSCVAMTDMFRAGLPPLFAQALDWARVCYSGDAGFMLNKYIARNLAISLQSAIPTGTAEETMAFAKSSFIDESDRNIQFDFSSLKVDFRSAVLINAFVAGFMCFAIYIRSARLWSFSGKLATPSLLLDDDTLIARVVSIVTLIFLCFAPVICVAAVVIFDKLGLAIPGPPALSDFADRFICAPLGTACGSRVMTTISVGMTASAAVAIFAEVLMIRAVFNCRRYIRRAAAASRKSKRIESLRDRFFGRKNR
jgi:hypothetical protein